MSTSSSSAGAGVRFPPPLLFVVGLLVAWLLNSRVHPLPLISGFSSPLFVRGAGYLLALLGLGIAAWGMITFARAKTAIIPNRPASTLVDSGPYRFTRNPMYTGITVAYIGGMLVLNSLWAVILLPVLLTLLYVFVVKREERYLTAEFGQAYEEYRRRVKRWV